MVGWGMEGGMASWTSLGRKSTVYQDLLQSHLVSLPVASGMEFCVDGSGVGCAFTLGQSWARRMRHNLRVSVNKDR